MRRDVDCRPHHYKVVWQKVHTIVPPQVSYYPPRPKKTKVEARWRLEECRNCGKCRGLIPGKKYYDLTKRQADERVKQNYEAYMDEVTMKALADI